MDIYKFDKCLLERLEESLNVLSWKDHAIPASQVRVEWSAYIELQIEPAGWQTLWNIPRVICEELNIRFPTVVFGFVEQVLFRDLKAVFLIQAVQDDDVHLPERHEVALVDLYPTLSQENTALNVECTAECLDCLRFFYQHVWMPWDNDNDDDLNWVVKHLESRIRFCYDLRKRSIKRTLAAHIRMLITEARYIQQRREYLELGLSDDEQLDDSMMDKSQITDLMRLHLRMAMIRSEIELLENPEMRHIYEEIHFDDEKRLKDVGSLHHQRGQGEDATDRNVSYVVTLPCKLQRQMELMRIAEKFLQENCFVQMCPSLQDVLSVCKASDHIFLSPGKHTIKFLEYLNDNGSITGLIPPSKGNIHGNPEEVIITSPDDDSILLIFDGHFTLENLVLDCRNIRSGILVKNGKVCLKNCRLQGNGTSSTQQGIVCSSQAELTLENCSVEGFATGIILNEGASLVLSNCGLNGCQIGLDLSANATKVRAEKTNICHASKCGIFVDGMAVPDTDAKCLSLKQISELKRYSSEASYSWSGECNFEDCKTNIYVINQSHSLASEKAIKSILDENINSIGFGDQHSPPLVDGEMVNELMLNPKKAEP